MSEDTFSRIRVVTISSAAFLTVLRSATLGTVCVSALFGWLALAACFYTMVHLHLGTQPETGDAYFFSLTMLLGWLPMLLVAGAAILVRLGFHFVGRVFRRRFRNL